jgi:hypothetical protein
MAGPSGAIATKILGDIHDAPADIPRAVNIVVASCHHGNVWLQLLDAQGDLVCIATLPVKGALVLAGTVLQQTARAIEKASYPAAGHA